MKKKFLILALFLCHFTVTFADHFLSFIIPCYNCEKWVEQAVDSIYQQTNLPCQFEIICTNDGSADNTLEVLTFLSEKYPEMHVYNHPKNLGGASARNTCVQNSRGDIIFCLDADNVLEPDSVALLIKHMDETGSDIVAFGGPKYFIDDFNEVGRVHYTSPFCTYTLADIIDNSTTPPCSGNYLYTRKNYDLAGGYPPQWVIDTMAFGFNQVACGGKMTYIPNTFYWHRHGIDSYFMREYRSGRINLHFFELWLSHEDLFTEASIQLIEEQYEHAMKHEPYFDFIWFLDTHALKLRS